MYLSMSDLPKVVGAGPMTVFAPGSVGSGDKAMVPGEKPPTESLTSQIVENAAIAKAAKAKIVGAVKSPGSKQKIIQNSIALTRATTGRFKKGVAMGFWPVDQIASAATSAYTAVADKATELVTGISKEQLDATEKVAAAQAQMIRDRVASGAMTPQQGTSLTAITQTAAKDARDAATDSVVLKDTAVTATNSTLKALGLPEMTTTWKYIKWGVPILGLLVGAWIVYPYLKAARLPGEAARAAVAGALRNRWL